MKRAGISLALVVMLLLGAAAPVQAQAEETGLAAEAESFYRSVLAAKDRETLQTYLDCFSDQRRVELRAELPATLRQGLDTVLQQMKLPSITPVEENTAAKRNLAGSWMPAQPGTLPRAATPCAWKPAAKRAGQTR